MQLMLYLKAGGGIRQALLGIPWALSCNHWSNFSCQEAVCNMRALCVNLACQFVYGRARRALKERSCWRRTRQGLSSDAFSRLKILFGKKKYFCLHATGKWQERKWCAGNHSPCQQNQGGNGKIPSCMNRENAGKSGRSSFPQLCAGGKGVLRCCECEPTCGCCLKKIPSICSHRSFLQMCSLTYFLQYKNRFLAAHHVLAGVGTFQMWLNLISSLFVFMFLGIDFHVFLLKCWQGPFVSK